MISLVKAVAERSPGWDRSICSIHRILLVDDEIDVWWSQNLATLATAGYTVDTAADGEAAWELLQARTYDLLITDNKMPKLWGIDLIKRIRAHGITIPIIIASTMLPTIPPGEEKFFGDVRPLEKPLSGSQLLGLVEKSSRKTAAQPVPLRH